MKADVLSNNWNSGNAGTFVSDQTNLGSPYASAIFDFNDVLLLVEEELYLIFMSPSGMPLVVVPNGGATTPGFNPLEPTLSVVS